MSETVGAPPGRRTGLAQRAAQLEAAGVFLGGPARLFDVAGRKLLMTLLEEGLDPGAKVLDVGCGCLRGGYWLIHFLDAGGYCGIEPNAPMLQAGIDGLLEPGLVAARQPRFDHNDRFDLGVFGETFDFVVARSIWTHAAKGQIRTMLDGFKRHGRAEAVLLASYIRARSEQDDYAGERWIGRSHESDEPGMVHHRLEWIEAECARRGLQVREIVDPTLNFGDQTWLRVRRR